MLMSRPVNLRLKRCADCAGSLNQSSGSNHSGRLPGQDQRSHMISGAVQLPRSKNKSVKESDHGEDAKMGQDGESRAQMQLYGARRQPKCRQTE